MKLIKTMWLYNMLILAMALPMFILYAIGVLSNDMAIDLVVGIEKLGYLVTGSFAIAAFSSVWAGAVVDVLGVRYAMLLHYLLLIIVYILIGFAVDYQWVFIAVCIGGVAQALANPVTNLLIAEQISPQQKAFVIGLKQSGVQIAALIAGLLLPFLSLRFGWKLSLSFVIVIALICAITVPFVTTKKSATKKKRFEVLVPKKPLLNLMAAQLCIGIALSAYITNIPNYAINIGMTLQQAGGLIAVFGFCGIFSRVLITPLAAKVNDEAYVLSLLAAIAAVVLIIMSINAHNVDLIWFTAVVFGLTIVATNAIAMSMIVKDRIFGSIAQASGFVSIAFFLGIALGPILYTLIFIYAGSTLYAWLAVSAVLVAAVLIALQLVVVRNKSGSLRSAA